MLSPAARLKPIRRIIAGLDSQGRSTVLVDSNSPHVQTVGTILNTTEQGDVLIQRGTNHAWSNRTSAQTLVGFVLIDAHPVPRS